MLRITVHDSPQTLTLQLEGKFAGPWVQVMERCWKDNLASRPRPNLRVDLTGVTSIDAEGKECLTGMRKQGAEFIAGDCLMKAIVAEIIRAGTR